MDRCAWQWVRQWVLTASVSTVLILPGTGGAEQIYRCQAYGGGLFWSATHCQQHQALIERVQSVPPGIGFAQQVRVAEQALGQGSKNSSVRVGEVNRTQQLALQRQAKQQARQQARCAKWQAEFERQRQLAQQKQTARRQEAIRLKQQTLREQLGQAACQL